MLGAEFTNRFRAAQPRWSRYVWWLIGIPSWLIFGVAVLSSVNGEGLPIWGWVAFGVCALVVSVQWVCFLNMSTEQPRSK